MMPNVISHKPHITSPARSWSVRRARPRQARPAISASSASGYSQPISGPNRLPISFVQPPDRPRNPPALYWVPPGAVVVGPVRPPPPPPKAWTEPGNDIPKRSAPLYPNTIATALLFVDPST